MLRILDAVLGKEPLAADTHCATGIAVKIRHLGAHAARDDGLGGAVLRCFPPLCIDIFLNRDGERMHRVLLGRRREEDHLLLRDPVRRADERDLRHADCERPRLVKDDGIGARKRLDVVAALDEDAAFRRRRDGGGHGGRCGEFQPAGEIDEEQIQHALPVACRPVDDRRAEEGHRHEVVRHLIGEVLHRRAARLSLLDEVDDVCEGGIAADFLHGDHDLARLDDAARVDGRARLLHRRAGFARDGRLRHRRVAAQDVTVDDDLLPRVRRDDVAGAYFLHGNLALNLVFSLALNEPDKSLIERKQSRDLRACLLRRVVRQHLGTVAEDEEHEARLGLAREHRGNDGRRRERVRVRFAVADEPLDAGLDEFARDGDDEQSTQYFH